MGDAQDRIVAVQQAILWSQAETAEPYALSIGEVERIVDGCKLASTWAVDTDYNIGDWIVPPTRNGSFYEVIQPGTSASVAPAYTFWSTRLSTQFYDGSSNPRLLWRHAGEARFNAGMVGAEWNVYDIRGAIGQCWALKAAKAAQFVDLDDIADSQIRKHCLEQAARWIPYQREIQLVRA